MHFSSILLPLLATASSALPALRGPSLHTRATIASDLATKTLVQDVDNINTGVLALTSAIEAFPGSNIGTALVSGVEVLASGLDIHLVNRNGYVHALASPQLDAEQSARVVNEVVDTVGVSIPNSVDLLVSKKALFEQAGLSSVTLASLKLLLNDHDTFSAAVQAKFDTGDAEVVARGTEVVDRIHDAIQGGIDAFSS